MSDYWLVSPKVAFDLRAPTLRERGVFLDLVGDPGDPSQWLCRQATPRSRLHLVRAYGAPAERLDSVGNGKGRAAPSAVPGARERARAAGMVAVYTPSSEYAALARLDRRQRRLHAHAVRDGPLLLPRLGPGALLGQGLGPGQPLSALGGAGGAFAGGLSAQRGLGGLGGLGGSAMPVWSYSPCLLATMRRLEHAFSTPAGHMTIAPLGTRGCGVELTYTQGVVGAQRVPVPGYVCVRVRGGSRTRSRTR